MGIALADADPLGVNQNVTFDKVGGLDERELHSASILSLLVHPIISRRQLVEGDDASTPLISRGVPTIQSHPSPRYHLLRPPGHC